VSPFRMLALEIRHRWLSFVIGLFAVTGAVALFVALLTMGRASNRETKRLMRNLGFNVLVVPGETDMASATENWLAADGAARCDSVVVCGIDGGRADWQVPASVAVA